MISGHVDRWTVERAVKASSLPAPSRLLVYTLLGHVTNGTLVVPAKHAPSLTALTKETGLSRSAVADHLNGLEAGGWIERRRPTKKEALADRSCTGYTINVPADVLASLVQDADQSRSWTSPGAGPVEQEDLFSASPGAGLVQEPDGGSPGGGHSPMYSSSSSPTEKKKGGAGGNSRRTKTDSEHPRFAEWYAAYPLRKERAAAVAAFNNAVKKVGDVQVLFDAAERYRDHDPYVRRGFIKNPANWLNKGCWDDEIKPQASAAATTGDGSGPSRLPPRDGYNPSKILGKGRS